jgi:hypothetical protein
MENGVDRKLRPRSPGAKPLEPHREANDAETAQRERESSTRPGEAKTTYSLLRQAGLHCVKVLLSVQKCLD